MRKIALGILCVIILSFSWSVNVFASSEEDNPKPEEPTKITYKSPDPEQDVKPRETTDIDIETVANEETEADKLRDKYELKIEGLNYDYAEKYESAAGGVTLALIIVAMFLLVFTLELIHTKYEVMRLTEKIEKMEKMNN